MSRFLATAIRKFSIPDEVEGYEAKPIEKDDCLFKVGIPFDSVVSYNQFNPNPKMPYYRYTGPLTEVMMTSGDEFTILCDFNTFDEAYFKYYTEKQIMIKPN